MYQFKLPTHHSLSCIRNSFFANICGICVISWETLAFKVGTIWSIVEIRIVGRGYLDHFRSALRTLWNVAYSNWNSMHVVIYHLINDFLNWLSPFPILGVFYISKWNSGIPINFLLQIWMPNCQTSKIYFLQQEEHIFRYTFKILNSYFAKALESSWQKRDACNKQRKARTLPTQSHCKLLTHGRSCCRCLHRDHRFSQAFSCFTFGIPWLWVMFRVTLLKWTHIFVQNSNL